MTAQGTKVITALMAAGDSNLSDLNHVVKAMCHAQGIAFVLLACCKRIGQAGAVLDPVQQQNAAIERQPDTVEPGRQFVARAG